MEAQHKEQVGGNPQGLWNILSGFVEPMALKCALELRIPDIIHSHGSPMSLSQIAAAIGTPSLNAAYLKRVMRLLVHNNIFAVVAPSDDQLEETLYHLTHYSRLLLQDSEMTLAPTLLMATHPLVMDPWQHLSSAIKDGTSVLNKAYGPSSLWELASTNPEFNELFNTSMENMTKFAMQEILERYKDGFEGIHTLADVGGGSGYLLSQIVQANWPRIKGINFDLQHVVDTAPTYAGVTHVRGDMFDFVPHADAIILKWVLHDWEDEECQKILRNCRRALPKKTGKLILVETVAQTEGQEVDISVLKLDLVLMVQCGGKERTRLEWTKLLETAAFSKLKFISTQGTPYSIIEAYAA